MQGISKVAMGSALVVAVSLTLIFLLLLLLYVELCCSLLWHRRLRSPPLPTTAASPSQPQSKLPQGEQGAATTAAGDGQKGEGTPGSPFDKPFSPSAAAYHAPGVLQTPPSFFFATISEPPAALRKQGEMSPTLCGKTGFHFIGLVPSPCSATKGDAVPGGMGGGRSWLSPPEHFVCISNPIYDGACGGTGAGDDEEDSTTPFETPDTSPSRLEGDDDDEEEEEVRELGEGSPALKPMKKLPPVLPLGTSAAFLADGRRSLATSISVTDTNRPSSSSSSNSPSTSPSW